MFYSILYVQKSNDRPSISGLRHASCSQRRTPRRCWNRIDLRPVLSRRVGNAHHAPDVPKSTLSRVANLKTGSCCFHVLKCTFSIPPTAQRNIIFILFVQGKGVHKVIHGWANAKVHAAQGNLGQHGFINSFKSCTHAWFNIRRCCKNISHEVLSHYSYPSM